MTKLKFVSNFNFCEYEFFDKTQDIKLKNDDANCEFLTICPLFGSIIKVKCYREFATEDIEYYFSLMTENCKDLRFRAMTVPVLFMVKSIAGTIIAFDGLQSEFSNIDDVSSLNNDNEIIEKLKRTINQTIE